MISNNSELGITWLGHGGFLLEGGGVRVVIDPYLSDSLAGQGMKRSFPPPVDAEHLNPDIICITHDHPDHFDEQTMLPLYKYCHNCVIVAPKSVIAHCRRLGFNPARLVTMTAGQTTFSYEDARVRAVKALHREEDAVGYAITLAGFKVYLSGDTRRDESIVESVRNALGGNPDVMMVCINGRGGNMDDVDAFRMVRALEPKVAIPMHYGLFRNDTADPRPFVDTVTRVGIQAIMPDPGKKVTLQGEHTPIEQEQELIPA